jgi:hypothetical protein
LKHTSYRNCEFLRQSEEPDPFIIKTLIVPWSRLERAVHQCSETISSPIRVSDVVDTKLSTTSFGFVAIYQRLDYSPQSQRAVYHPASIYRSSICISQNLSQYTSPSETHSVLHIGRLSPRLCVKRTNNPLLRVLYPLVSHTSLFKWTSSTFRPDFVRAWAAYN